MQFSKKIKDDRGVLGLSLGLVIFLIFQIAGGVCAETPADLMQFKHSFTLSEPDKEFIDSLAPLMVMIDDNFFPLSTWDAKKRREGGISVDLFRFLAEKVGLRYTILHKDRQSWAEKEELLRNGDIDLLMPVSFTLPRAATGLFSSSFYTSYYGVIGRGKVPYRIKETYDLAAYKIGVTKASAIISFVESFVPQDKMITFDNPRQMYGALQKGDIDVALQNKSVFREDRFNMGILDLKMIHTIIEFPRHYSFYFHESKNNRKLMAIIDKYLGDLNIEALLAHYDQNEEELIERYIEQQGREKFLVVGIVALLALLGLLTAVFFNHRRLTQQLSANLQQIKRQQAELAKSEYLLKESQKAGVIGSYKVDFGTGQCETSEVLDEIFGIGTDYNKTLAAWLAAIYPEDLETTKTFLNLVTEGKVGRFTREYRIVRQSDQAVRWLYSVGRAIVSEEGKAVAMIGTLQDITERKESEVRIRRLRDMLHETQQIAHIGGWELDIVSQVLYWSDETYRIFETNPDEFTPTIEAMLAFYRETSEPVLREAMQAAMRDGKDFSLELELITAKGRQLYVNVTSKVVWEDGKIAKIIGAIQDNTRHHFLEEQLRQAQKMEAIGTLAGGIAHDFNNILGAILGYAEMAIDGCQPDSTTAKDLREVITASNRAKDLVKQILAFSRQAETHKIPLQPAPVVKESLKLLRSTLPTTITIIQDIDPNTNVILADPTQLHQIVMNLCTNAFHAMEDGKGTLTVSLANATSDKEMELKKNTPAVESFVQLTIEDTGVGIGPEVLEKIFDPYFTTKEAGKGTGMGLSIVHGIVKSYGGMVSCQSRLGEGTVFRVLLPAANPDFSLSEHSPEPLAHGHEHILFVDDEDMLARMGKSMLERLGYKVTAVTDSTEAFELFKNNPGVFDLVITDQTMPIMTGVELSRRILREQPTIPIILCTGFSNVISPDEVAAMGIKGFAMKPLSQKRIAVIIRSILDGKPIP